MFLMAPNNKSIDELSKKIKYMKDSNSLEDVREEIGKLNLENRVHLFLKLTKENINIPKEFDLELNLQEQINSLFIGDFEESHILTANFDTALLIGEVSLINSIIDIEEYRTLIRFLYTDTSAPDQCLLKLNLSIVRYLKSQSVNEEILSIFSRILRYIGIPLAQIDELKEFLVENFPEAQNEILQFYELPIATIQRYPQYIEEMGENFNYDEIIPSLKKWLDNSLLSRIEKTTFQHFLESTSIKDINSPEVLWKQIKAELEQKNLRNLPLSYNSVIKPHLSTLKPKQIKQSDLTNNIPKTILPSFVEKLAYSYSVSEADITINFLGGAQIGTMGILISTPKSSILIDYGMSVANYQLPQWHERLNHLDAVLVTHAHLDHSGGLPYLYAHGFDGYVFGSGITKTLIEFLLKDNLELMKKNISEDSRNFDHRFRVLSHSRYLYQMLEKYLPINSDEEIQITPDISIKPYNAHHIQGSLAYLINTNGKKILFTGDVNLGATTLFGKNSVNLPTDSDLTIIDSTYYGQKPIDRVKRDNLLAQTVKEDKRIIIPAFSIGRAQEIMIKLDNLGLTSDRKISMIGMATKVSRATGLKTRGFLSDFLDSAFEDEVIITGGGMLNGGFARELVEQTKNDPLTTIILCGYLAKTTLGYRLLNNLEPSYKQKVVYTRFSGHSTHLELNNYLNSISGLKALVHLGELSKDPFTEQHVRNSKLFKESEYYIPSIGSELSI